MLAAAALLLAGLLAVALLAGFVVRQRSVKPLEGQTRGSTASGAAAEVAKVPPRLPTRVAR